jgi:FlaA1/EpsC-like NDP-sugar epimerase
MEAQPLEAIANNVLGTYNVMNEARRHGVSTMLMISSDKAVNPTSVMGVTKRICELMLSAMPSHPTKFVSVRFGNVLGSNGSVIPTFNAQVAAGGPVTVTHPEMRRYFMTIPEAVQLVLLASTMGSGSEVFVLDMGEPIKILDLAKSIIRLNGREPGKDIEIRFTGMRPGEKLYEEVSTGHEDSLPTQHPKIRIFQGPRMSAEQVAHWPRELERVLEGRNAKDGVRLFKRLVPEYTPDASWGLKAPVAEPPLARAAGASADLNGAAEKAAREEELVHRHSLGLTG